MFKSVAENLLESKRARVARQYYQALKAFDWVDEDLNVSRDSTEWHRAFTDVVNCELKMKSYNLL